MPRIVTDPCRHEARMNSLLMCRKESLCGLVYLECATYFSPTWNRDNNCLDPLVLRMLCRKGPLKFRTKELAIHSGVKWCEFMGLQTLVLFSFWKTRSTSDFGTKWCYNRKTTNVTVTPSLYYKSWERRTFIGWSFFTYRTGLIGLCRCTPLDIHSFFSSCSKNSALSKSYRPCMTPCAVICPFLSFEVSQIFRSKIP